MTRYDDTLDALVAFDDEPLHGTLADALEAAGLRQLHVAETEKYAHVTYFFDGGREQRHAGEDWELVPSRRDVADLRPTRPRWLPPASPQRFAERFPRRLCVRRRQPREPRHGRPHAACCRP